LGDREVGATALLGHGVCLGDDIARKSFLLCPG
jgi:hypothetical protein